ncbi:hypothetical protein I204_02344 [Kwoniella mangroviensis CBS 8886]|nr:uncharacterized protein I203_02286 [Kwoniella mangroviensis CBS 8507]OCF68893.1 hypothetical protein I203_02286 [Kwoniella mangroviensis CBS 8507]OCF76645.1 hypothetical protein I204_02344 [Kwoniella mangroviensis CBS 8886]
MSRDPYIDVKREIESTLSTLPDLLSAHGSSDPSSSTYYEIQEELKNTLQILEGDLEDLEESVRVVEGMGDRWGISPDEVGNRRSFVERVKKDIRLLVKRQDDTLGVISGTLHTLASQAGLIGSEVAEQSEMLDDLGNRVDSTDTKLRKVQKSMSDFIRRNEETKSGWCIGILIVILMILLLLVIIT